jgi:tetratricopeptide (TPR) repeat protein
MSAIELLTGIGGLLAGLGSLLIGVAAIIKAIRQVLTARRVPKEERMRQPKRRKSVVLPFVPGVLLLLLSGGIFATRALTGEEQPLNVQLTAAAWEAFNKGDFERAIATAEKCIGEFRGSADREQAELENAKAPLPPKGKVSDAEKNAIFAKGLLNDVATCFFIKGRSAENLGRKDVAKQAYTMATKYKHARCWDPKGWFWSPAEAAADRLAGLD